LRRQRHALQELHGRIFRQFPQHRRLVVFHRMSLQTIE
jgi:hypothetical protein